MTVPLGVSQAMKNKSEILWNPTLIGNRVRGICFQKFVSSFQYIDFESVRLRGYQLRRTPYMLIIDDFQTVCGSLKGH